MIAAPTIEPSVVDSELDVLGVQVHWRGPAGCPDREGVRDALEQGDAAAAPDDARLSVDAEITRLPDRRWSMAAEVASPTGRERRTWIADDCETVTKLLVVIVGSALARAHEEAPAQASASAVPESDAVPRVPERKAAPTPPTSAALPPAVAPGRPRTRTEIGLRAAIGVESGGVPQVGPALAVGLVVSRPRWAVDAIAHWVLPRATTLPSDEQAGARLQIVAAALRGCARIGNAEIDVPLCAGIELGAVLGLGTGVDEPRRDRVLWAAAVLGPAMRMRVARRIALVLDTQLVIPLGRPRFELDGLGVVYEARTGGRALFGLEFRLR